MPLLTRTSTMPQSLVLFKCLRPRKSLSPRERQRYEQLEKGFIGEKMLENALNSMGCKNITTLFGCLFEVDNRAFQIDCLLLTIDKIYLLEVKNYTGDYYIENNQIYHLKSKNEIYNPVAQIERTEFLFRRLLNETKINLQAQSYVVFVNKDLMVYGAPVHLPIIYHHKLNAF